MRSQRQIGTGTTVTALVLAGTILALGCRGWAPRPGDPAPRVGDEISICGHRFHTGTKVVLWTDPGAYDAYRPHRHLNEQEIQPRDSETVARYGTFRRQLPIDLEERVHTRGWTLEDLGQVVDQVVLHYDACGTSWRCFEVLHDIRGLSCHFLVDLDGTIYQTLDVKERAWHAGSANDRSIGIEIAHVGAFPKGQPRVAWYKEGAHKTRIVVPDSMRGALPDDLQAQPAQALPIRGEIQGQSLVQYDFTDAQYEALVKLITSLCRVLPRVEARAPLLPDGSVVPHVLEDDELKSFSGIVGHYHLTSAKLDPGPAFNWARLLSGVRRLLRENNGTTASSR